MKISEIELEFYVTILNKAEKKQKEIIKRGKEYREKVILDNYLNDIFNDTKTGKIN